MTKRWESVGNGACMKMESNDEMGGEMNIDWSVAPEGTTHIRPGTDGYQEHWIKPGYFCVTGFEKLGWVKTVGPNALNGAITRPVEWDGKGVPPVGVLCEWKHSAHSEWQESRVNYIGAVYVILGGI